MRNGIKPDDIHKTDNTLTQRIYASERGRVTVKLDASGLADGQNARLTFFSRHAGWIGVHRRQGETRIVQVEQTRRTQGPALTGAQVWLRADIDVNGFVSFAYSTDGQDYLPRGEPHQAGWWNYRGTRISLFIYNNEAEAGHVDFEDFDYDY